MTTTLGRPASGLPRYYMDVGWYRHPTFAGLDVESLFLFEAIVGYCHEHATDGAVPADLEDLALALGVRLSWCAAGLPALVERSLLVDDGAGRLVMPDWAEHNPTKAEIHQQTSERSRAGALGNHRRWHAARGIVDPDCPHCTSPTTRPDDDRCPIATDRSPSHSDSHTASQTDRTDPSLTPAIAGPDRCPIAPAIATPSHGMGWDGMGTAAADASDSHPPPAPDKLHLDAEDHLDRHLVHRGAAIRNPAGYRIAQLPHVIQALTAGDDPEHRWPTRHPNAGTPPAPDHIPGTGHLGGRRTDATADLVTTDPRGAAVIDLDALRTRSA